MKGKTPAPAPETPGRLRAIPSVERILSAAAFAPLVAEYGRNRVKSTVVEHLGSIRASASAYDEKAAAEAVSQSLRSSIEPTLRRVVNGSGVIIHTNMGRAPVDRRVWDEAAAIATGYSNLELDLESGERGARDEHLSSICQALFGAEAAVLTNNNAAGTMLLLAATAAGKEVVVSRGELVEIGGSFRVPDVIQQGGARLREVGTTNRTRAADYAAAASRRTGAILRVHRSNFEITGFTETPSVEELAQVARSKKLPLLYDEGTGRVVDLVRYGFAAEPTLRELLAAGVDALSCSTDKLIGASQGGLILGSRAIVERCRRHPLMRALRVGKETFAIVAATLRAFATGQHETRIPIYRMLAAPLNELRERAAALCAGTSARLIESRCALGGGTTPGESIPSVAIEIAGPANALYDRFLHNDPPIVGRIVNDRFTIEVRTLLEEDVEVVRQALRDVNAEH